MQQYTIDILPLCSQYNNTLYNTNKCKLTDSVELLNSLPYSTTTQHQLYVAARV